MESPDARPRSTPPRWPFPARLAAPSITYCVSFSRLPRTVVRRLLLTLIDLGFVRTDEKDYWLTPKVLRLGMTLSF